MCSTGIHTGQGLVSLAAWVSRSPSVLRRSSKFPKRNVLGYVCKPGSSSERDTASQCHTSGIPASASYIPVADASFIALAFILASHYVTSPVTSRPFKDRFYLYSEPVMLKTFTKRPSMQRLVTSRNRGYIRNLRRFFTFFTVVFSHPDSNVHYIQLYSCRPHFVCVILYKLTFQMELFRSYMKLIVVPFIIYENVNKVLYSLT